MIDANDIGKLFATLQAAYGHSWAHKSDAIPVWHAKLKKFGFSEIMKAASEAIESYPDYPPSVGQLIEIIKKGKPRVSTFIEDKRESGKMSRLEWMKSQ
jgi:hypothetical protein